MHTYQVTRDFFLRGRIHRMGDVLELSERQARYLLISGAIKKHDTATEDATQTEPSPKPKRKRAAVKKTSADKRRTSAKSE